jgi:hypothetical protein
MANLFEQYGIIPSPSADPFFDPEGSGYDYLTATVSGQGPDDTGHWPSRDPYSGQILKGQGNETYPLTVQGEEDAGMRVYQGDDGRYYSQPTPDELVGATLFEQYGIVPSRKPDVADHLDIEEIQNNVKNTPEETIFKTLQRASEERHSQYGWLQDPQGQVQSSVLGELDKLYRVAKKSYQMAASAFGGIAKTAKAQEEIRNMMRHSYLNADHPIGRKMLERADAETRATLAALDRFQQFLPEVEEKGNIYESLPGRMFEDAVTGMAQMWPTMVSTIFNPAVGTGVATAQFAGDIYEDYRSQGVPAQKAWDLAVAEAMPQAMIESAGTFIQLKNLKSLTGGALKKMGVSKRFIEWFKNLRNGMATEGGEEFSQEVWSKIMDVYAEKGPEGATQDYLKKFLKIETWKDIGYATGTGAIGGAIFPVGGAAYGSGKRLSAKIRGKELQEPALEEDSKVVGAVEPIPVSVTDEIGAEYGGTPTTGVEFGLTDTTKVVKAGEKEEEVKPVREQQKIATKDMVDKMFGDLNDADLQYVLDHLPKQAKAVRDEIQSRLKAGQKPQGKAYVDEKAKAPGAEEELEIALPEGQGGHLEQAVESMMKTAPGFEARQWAESRVTEEMAVVHRIADALGSKVTFYRPEAGSPVSLINGFYSKGNDRIYVNEKSPAPDMFILGHESFHQMEANHKDLWDRAMEVVKKNATKFDEYKKAINEDRKKAGYEELNDVQVWREFGSDLAGQAFQNPKFWSELNRQQPDVFKALTDIVRKVIQKIKAAFEATDKNKHHNISKEGVKNLEAVEAAITKAYAEMVERKGKKVAEGRAAVTEEALNRMPRDRKVKVTAIHGETGQKVKVTEEAGKAIEELDTSIELYRQVRKCLKNEST